MTCNHTVILNLILLSLLHQQMSDSDNEEDDWGEMEEIAEDDIDTTPVVIIKTQKKPINMTMLEQLKSSKQSTLSDDVQTAMFTDTQLQLYYEQFNALNIKFGRDNVASSITMKSMQSLFLQLYRSIEYKQNETSKHAVEKMLDECAVCNEEFDSSMQQTPVILTNCGHRMICTECFNQYIAVKMQSGEFNNHWILCPSVDCRVPVSAEDILTQGSELTPVELLQFCRCYMYRKLARNENFISCRTTNCLSGWLQFGKAIQQTVVCSVCHLSQVIEKGKDGELDQEFKTMITKGLLRECPQCSHLTLKEMGICNVINCAKCNTWWNWRTRECGNSSRELKERARQQNTLWEENELQYQQQLEQSNPTEFKALLERNGMKYNAQYQRGSQN